MLITAKQLRWCWGVKPTAVLHVGAHEAEELPQYERERWLPVLWIEALPDKAARLSERLQHRTGHAVISALVWHEDGVALDLHRTSNDQSSSVFELGEHLTVEYPEIVEVAQTPLNSARLDTLLRDRTEIFDFLNIDIQGAELNAIRGLGHRIKDVRWLYTEVSTKRLYVGAPLISELDSHLDSMGFSRVDCAMTNKGWGDALYIRREFLPRLRGARHFARRFAARVRRSWWG